MQAHRPTPRWAERIASPGWVLLPLRAFLGVTFLFAGAQKLADPSFFRSSSPASIEAQLHAAVRSSPVGGLLGGLTHIAVLIGIMIAVAEIVVGAFTVLGIFARPGAVLGALLSVGFLLTISWHSSPYYYGSDVVFLFAWLPLILAGDGGVLSLTSVLRRKAMQEVSTDRRTPRLLGAPGHGATMELDRRAFLLTVRAAAIVAAGAVTLGAVGGAVTRLLHTPGSSSARSLATLETGADPSAPPPSTTGSAIEPSTTGSASSPPTTAGTTGTVIGRVTDVPERGAATFVDPRTGRPAVIVHDANGALRAFSAVCTHAGCTVQYSGADFVCPCHGARFSAADGTVIVGPAEQPLSEIPVTISDGRILETR